MSVLVGIMALTAPAAAKTDLRQFCQVTWNGTTHREECQALGIEEGYYETVRGDYFIIFCEKPGFPLATQCVFVR